MVPPPSYQRAVAGRHTSIERFFGLQRLPVCGWTAVMQRVALAYAATVVIALAAQQAGRPKLIRSSKCVLSHLWKGPMG
jgi:hypothetical protein